jgi:hypothetical protein
MSILDAIYSYAKKLTDNYATPNKETLSRMQKS